MRERFPGVWELIAEAGRDPVTGKRRQVSRIFRGNLGDARKARATPVTELGRGRHTGTAVKAEDRFYEWSRESERRGRSPATIAAYTRAYHHNIAATLGRVAVAKATTMMLTDLYGAHQRRG
jgi:phage terminase large subunit-like protein